MKQIFTHDNWTMFEQEESNEMYWNMDYDVVTHSCGWFHQRRVITAWDMLRGTHCTGCGEEIPEEIIGIWKLHNMNSIQRDCADPEFYEGIFIDAPRHL